MQIFNSLTRNKSKFTPLKENEVRMYVCGMTVYDYCHIGHARVMVVFDSIARWIRHLGYKLTYVRNITDVDDKILNRISESKQNLKDFTQFFIDAMQRDQKHLNILPPDIEPKATDHIEQMVKLVVALLKKGVAYEADNGDIYFSVRKFKDYGKLSGKSIDDLMAGARIGVDSIHKKDPLDFVLWKASKPGEVIKWKSDAFHPGRPGWHIECSAMATHYLGNQIDIHGGGEDLIFPHHENEIAQSEAISEEKFANYWIHNAFISVNGEKMSKSLGNFFTISEVLKHFDGEIIRFFIIRSHYRSPINYSEDNLIDSRNSITKLYNSIAHYEQLAKIQFQPNNNEDLSAPNSPFEKALLAYYSNFHNAMNDDFNTPLAIATLFEISGDINKFSPESNNSNAKNLKDCYRLVNLMVSLGNLLGILGKTTDLYFHSDLSIQTEEIELLIAKRSKARMNKDFQTSDQIRNTLKDKGIELLDSKEGTTWKRIK